MTLAPIPTQIRFSSSTVMHSETLSKPGRTQDRKELNRKGFFPLIFLDQRADLPLIDFSNPFLKGPLLVIELKKHGYLHNRHQIKKALMITASLVNRSIIV
jgi:hypothetical protein